MLTYAKPIPVDRNGNLMQSYPPAASALGSLHRENASASSVTAFTDDTTVIEVAVSGTPAGIRWAVNQSTSVITAATGANFDHIVLPNEVRRFVVPRRIAAPAPSIVGLNTREGLFPAVATISTGVGSVLLTQY